MRTPQPHYCIWAIHGQLQSPKVWFPFQSSRSQWHLESLWEQRYQDYSDWGQQFAEKVCATSHSPRILIGYSLGGRLAMWSICHHPALWDRAIIISADPGAASPETKENQLQHDLGWSERFRHEEWASLLRDWQAQPVFQADTSPVLCVEEDRRLDVAHLLDVFSKGRQPDLIEGLGKSNIPITYISGELDKKYSAIGQVLEKEIPNLKHLIMPGLGHRVPWGDPNKFKQWLSEIGLV